MNTYFKFSNFNFNFFYIIFFRLLSKQISAFNGRLLICNACLYHTNTKERMEIHKEKECGKCVTRMPEREKACVKYIHSERQMEIPFVVYADFECVLEDVDVSRSSSSSNSNSNFIKRHIPCAYAFNIKCSFSDNLDRFKIFVNSNSNREIKVGEHFVNSLVGECRDLYKKHLEQIVPMLPLTPLEEENFQCALDCSICGKPLGNEVTVRDHCHLSGKYRGAAHNSCNLNYKVPNFIPIYFHNFSSYDCHLFVKDLLNITGETNVIPLNKELYIALSHTIRVYSDEEIEILLSEVKLEKTKKNIPITIIEKDLEEIRKEKKSKKVELRFLDSFRFMAASLDTLASNLYSDDFRTVRKHFPDPEEFNLIKRKGVFPYEYVTSLTKLNENNIPSIDSFYSKLNDKECSEEDYLHAQKVWKKFNCNSIRDYMQLYLKTDVLLLTDVFENFRKVCRKIYNLDAPHYYTTPGLSWDAMLKYTKIELELLTDLEMYNFIKRGIRGGLTQCSKRYSKANHKYLENYDNTKPSEYILYLDVNNLYGWAMSESLPYGGFAWTNDFIHPRDIPKNSDIGYIYEVDLSYPFSCHDHHNDLPFCAENKIIGGSKHEKLVADLSDKRRYIIHYKTLQQCLDNGLVLRNVHRILQFKQKPWLKPYIDLNTQHRARAISAFEKDFFKLLNNAVYGKTMENVDNRKDVRLVREWNRTSRNCRGIGELISKPNFHSILQFTDNLWAIQMNKTLTYYSKPIYLGFCVLELSKWKMYDFHYAYMKPKYGNNISLNYMDTDSFIYSIKTNDFYRDIKNDINDRFDTSSYPVNNCFNFPCVNKKVIGMMKDETEGKFITEYVGLAPKVYSYSIEGKKDINKAKGVKKCVVNKYDIQTYKNVLLTKIPVVACMHTFTSKLHSILTNEINKVALSFSDTKRNISSNGINTYAWHHYQLDTGDGEVELDMLLQEIDKPIN